MEFKHGKNKKHCWRPFVTFKVVVNFEAFVHVPIKKVEVLQVFPNTNTCPATAPQIPWHQHHLGPSVHHACRSQHPAPPPGRREGLEGVRIWSHGLEKVGSCETWQFRIIHLDVHWNKNASFLASGDERHSPWNSQSHMFIFSGWCNLHSVGHHLHHLLWVLVSPCRSFSLSTSCLWMLLVSLTSCPYTTTSTPNILMVGACRTPCSTSLRTKSSMKRVLQEFRRAYI